ncbi:MAG: GAF domain-containing sensor histidine kinase [Chloroflexi bacterium]|nr:GAF domain-containing sensor histidine kinase [Chloroflexota bacterium]MCI0648715.1 GAF domain-containing sensor histidine kinase [Chloroflexota bacterium]MCI0732082.1 GAF domain-containing sensor histidine kinase [Chloroflexota bacterium]
MPQREQISQQALEALNQAALAIAMEVSLDKVLQQITDSALRLVGATYAALGVPDADGYMSKFLTSGIAAEDEAKIAHRPVGLGLLGILLREGRALRLPRLGDDPRSVGFPPGHPPMTTFLGVPIIGSGEVLGNLYLTDKRDDQGNVIEFTAGDQELVEMLAAHAAIAIQNARLYEQIGRLAIIDERARIGMDLHDGVIQSIYAVGLTLESARLLMPANPDQAGELMQRAIDGLNDVIRDIRNFILDLRPHRFTGDLEQALARLVREFQANAMVPTTLRLPGSSLTGLPFPIARTVFLTTQEALANIARHARASEVTVDVRQEQDKVTLTVTDNGRGFEVAKQSQSTGHGLANMRTRAEEHHGTFIVRSIPGRGTSVYLKLPC